MTIISKLKRQLLDLTRPLVSWGQTETIWGQQCFGKVFSLSMLSCKFVSFFQLWYCLQVLKFPCHVIGRVKTHLIFHMIQRRVSFDHLRSMREKRQMILQIVFTIGRTEKTVKRVSIQQY